MHSNNPPFTGINKSFVVGLVYVLIIVVFSKNFRKKCVKQTL
jgi:hypothetical protein